MTKKLEWAIPSLVKLGTGGSSGGQGGGCSGGSIPNMECGLGSAAAACGVGQAAQSCSGGSAPVEV